MKKPDKVQGKGKAKRNANPDAAFAKAYPVVNEYLVSTEWDDGSERERSTISLFIEDGAVKLALADKELEQSLYVASDSLEGAFLTLEKAVAGGKHEWRAWGKRKK